MSRPEFKKDIIIFYDILFDVPGRSLSNNTATARYCLELKGLQYHTEWVTLADIREHCQKIGAEPTGVAEDGSPFYTLPVIHDPSTGTTVSDSFKIAQYLDKKYPERPQLIPPGMTSLLKSFVSAVGAVEVALYPAIFPLVVPLLSGSASQEYVKRTRGHLINKPLGAAPTVDEWAKLKGVLDTFDSWFETGSDKKLYLTGKEACLADIILAGRIFWLQKIFGAESLQWQAIKGWHGGRWEWLLNELKEKK